MKFPHLIALVAAIAVIHLIVITLVMNGGCGAPSPSSGKPESAKTESGPPESGDGGARFTPPEPNDVIPVIPGGSSKPAAPGKKFPPPVSGKLPPPAKPSPARLAVYNYKYAVNGRIPRIPLTNLASSGILLDAASRNILWMKNPNKPFPIASMTKIMTLLLAYEDAASGRVPLDTRIPATKGALAIREGAVWMKKGESFTLEKLIEAAAVKSANDAALVIAEYLGNGGVDVFVKRMNARAAELGMKNTRFYNPHGLPGKKAAFDNASSPEDLLRLCEHVSGIPAFRRWTSMRRADFRDPGASGYLVMWNHNRLLPGAKYGVQGVDGIKTGFTSRAGFCLAVSGVRDGKRLIGVVTGFGSSAERDRCSRDLMEWGFLRAKDPSAPADSVVLPGQGGKKAVRTKRAGKAAPKKSSAARKNKK